MTPPVRLLDENELQQLATCPPICGRPDVHLELVALARWAGLAYEAMTNAIASGALDGFTSGDHMRKVLGGLIDKSLTDRQIFERLLKEQGPDLLRPHLLP